MGDAPVVVRSDGAVGRVTLNRPDKRNALDRASVDALLAAIAAFDSDDDVRVIVIDGAGPDFCAGADLTELERIAAGAAPLENIDDAQALGSLFVRIRRVSKPVIAAVQGNAIAGGAGLATACDIVLAADNAVFGYPEVHLGFVPAMVMALLRRTLGEKLAFELVVRGDRIDAHTAHRIGLVNRVFAADAFDSAVAEYVNEITRRSTSAVRLTKRLFYGMDGMSFEDAIARGAEINALARDTADCRDGVRRFLEKKQRTD